MIKHVCLRVFIDFLVPFHFHSQEQRSRSTPSLFEEIDNSPYYLYKRQLGTKPMCLICDCNGDLSLSNKPDDDRHCFFYKLCTNGGKIRICWCFFSILRRILIWTFAELEMFSNILADWFQKFSIQASHGHTYLNIN